MAGAKAHHQGAVARRDIMGDDVTAGVGVG